MTNLIIFLKMILLSVLFLLLATFTLVSLIAPAILGQRHKVRVHLKILKIRCQVHYIYSKAIYKRLFTWN